MHAWQKYKAYLKSYSKLGTNDRKNDIFSKVKERNIKDLGNHGLLKDDDHKIFVNNMEIKERWFFFCKLANVHSIHGLILVVNDGVKFRSNNYVFLGLNKVK